MAYSLQDFVREGQDLLATEDGSAAREQMRANLEKLLADADFRREHLRDDDESGMKQIYEDPDHGFCVLIYNMDEPRVSPPHDHGRSWAIYGQAKGYTDMTVWSRPAADAPLEKVRSYRLHPGKAGLYDVGDIHSIDYPAAAKFVRVTGTDMAKEARSIFDTDTGKETQIKHVGTGDCN